MAAKVRPPEKEIGFVWTVFIRIGKGKTPRQFLLTLVSKNFDRPVTDQHVILSGKKSFSHHYMPVWYAPVLAVLAVLYLSIYNLFWYYTCFLLFTKLLDITK